MKNNKYTVKEKLSAAQFAVEHSIHAAAKKFGVDRRRIREWVQYMKVGRFDDAKLTAARLPGAGRKMIDEKLDEELYQWVTDKRGQGCRVTGRNFTSFLKMLMEQSLIV